MSIQIKTIAVTGEKQTEIMNLTTPVSSQRRSIDKGTCRSALHP